MERGESKSDIIALCVCVCAEAGKFSHFSEAFIFPFSYIFRTWLWKWKEIYFSTSSCSWLCEELRFSMETWRLQMEAKNTRSFSKLQEEEAHKNYCLTTLPDSLVSLVLRRWLFSGYQLLPLVIDANLIVFVGREVLLTFREFQLMCECVCATT